MVFQKLGQSLLILIAAFTLMIGLTGCTGALTSSGSNSSNDSSSSSSSSTYSDDESATEDDTTLEDDSSSLPANSGAFPRSMARLILIGVPLALTDIEFLMFRQ